MKPGLVLALPQAPEDSRAGRPGGWPSGRSRHRAGCRGCWRSRAPARRRSWLSPRSTARPWSVSNARGERTSTSPTVSVIEQEPLEPGDQDEVRGDADEVADRARRQVGAPLRPGLVDPGETRSGRPDPRVTRNADAGGGSALEYRTRASRSHRCCLPAGASRAAEHQHPDHAVLEVDALGGLDPAQAEGGRVDGRAPAPPARPGRASRATRATIRRPLTASPLPRPPRRCR